MKLIGRRAAHRRAPNQTGGCPACASHLQASPPGVIAGPDGLFAGLSSSLDSLGPWGSGVVTVSLSALWLAQGRPALAEPGVATPQATGQERLHGSPDARPAAGPRVLI